MKCPVCNNVELRMAERQGVEIDYCPECRGVWLDRGELDKIIARSAQETPLTHAPVQERQARYEPSDVHGHGYHGKDIHGHYGHDHHYKKKKSFISELFDFD